MSHRQRDLESNPIVFCASVAHMQTTDNSILIVYFTGSREDELQLYGAVSHEAGWRDDLLGYQFKFQKHCGECY